MGIAETVARGRALSAKYMPDDVTIVKPGERVPDGRGGYTSGEPTPVQTKGRMRDFSGSERVVASRMTEKVEGVLVLPFEEDVKSTYSLEVNGEKYAIKHVEVGSEAYTADRKVFVARS